MMNICKKARSGFKLRFPSPFPTMIYKKETSRNLTIIEQNKLAHVTHF